jgi:uncharacterized spore protein YtfJ
MIGDVSDTLESVKREIAERLTAHTAYGEPVTVDGVTVIPVARVMVGFGAGSGVGEAKQPQDGEEAAPPPTGGGGAGGGVVQPLGFIEVSATGARWVPLEPPVGETIMRALGIAAILVPFGGRRFFLGRLVMMALVQLVVGRMFRPNLPPLPEGLRFGRTAEGAG